MGRGRDRVPAAAAAAAATGGGGGGGGSGGGGGGGGTASPPRTLATLLFILSPASPFATSLYAEAWHALGLGLALLLAARGRPWASAAGLALAAAARSTGVLCALWALATPPAAPAGPPTSSRAARAARAARSLGDRAARAALAASPFLAWQAHAWATFCRGGTPAVAPRPPWCDARIALPFTTLSIPRPPLLAVQAREWGVGPGRYWRHVQRAPLCPGRAGAGHRGPRRGRWRRPGQPARRHPR